MRMLQRAIILAVIHVYVNILRMIQSCTLFIYNNFLYFLYFRRINNLLQPKRFTQPPNPPQRGSITAKKHTKSVNSLATNSYFLILLRCVTVQKQAVEVDQRLFVILRLFKVHNSWNTAILKCTIVGTRQSCTCTFSKNKIYTIYRETHKKTLIEGPTADNEIKG